MLLLMYSNIPQEISFHDLINVSVIRKSYSTKKIIFKCRAHNILIDYENVVKNRILQQRKTYELLFIRTFEQYCSFLEDHKWQFCK